MATEEEKIKELKTFKEAVENSHWKKVMEEKLTALKHN